MALRNALNQSSVAVDAECVKLNQTHSQNKPVSASPLLHRRRRRRRWVANVLWAKHSIRWRQRAQGDDRRKLTQSFLFIELSAAHNLFYCACIYLRSRSSYCSVCVCSATVCAHAYATIHIVHAFSFRCVPFAQARTFLHRSHSRSVCADRRPAFLWRVCIHTGTACSYRRVAVVRHEWKSQSILSVRLDVNGSLCCCLRIRKQ